MKNINLKIINIFLNFSHKKIFDKFLYILFFIFEFQMTLIFELMIM